MKHAKLAILIGLLMMLPLVSSITITNHTVDSKSELVVPIPDVRMQLSYDPHAVIVIANDSDFQLQAEREVWPGDGSIDAPFQITGWNITSDSACIDIRDVSLYFIIQDCYVSTILGVRTNGIFLENVTHASIREVVVVGKDFGVFASFCDNLQISGSMFIDSIYRGIYIEASDNVAIDSCEVYGTDGTGVVINQCPELVVSNCDFYDNMYEGIHFLNSDYCNVTSTFSYDNGASGVVLWQSDFCTLLENTMYGNSRSFLETGIHIEGSSNTTIIGNELYNNDLAGIYLWNSPYTMILENEIYNNTDLGIEGIFSDNCTVQGNDIWDNGWYHTGYWTKAGIVIGETQGWVIEANRIWNNSYSGIELNDVINCFVNDNQIFNNSDHGVFGFWAHYIEVNGNDISGNGWNPLMPDLCGIFTTYCSNWTIIGNEIWSNSDNGIYMDANWEFGYSIIHDNVIFSNENFGILLTQMVHMVISENILYGQFMGLDMIGNYCNITGNVAYDNDYGIGIEGGMGNTFLGNDMGWNALENAYDLAGMANNHWSYGEEGNWYSDYSGEGPYVITAFAAPGAYDYFPHKSLEVNATDPAEYEISTVEKTMLFPAQARNPLAYEVYANDSLLYHETWDGLDIEANVDGLAAGIYGIMVMVYHISGHTASAISNLTITDLTPPEWDPTPTDQEVYEGQSFSYLVSAIDPSGIAGWTVNGTAFMIDNGLITNATVLSIGDYALNITVWDHFGNWRSIMITIQVIPSPTTTTTGTGPPPSPVLVIVILGAGGAVVVVLIAASVLRKRPG